jgi:hypothetical protein
VSELETTFSQHFSQLTLEPGLDHEAADAGTHPLLQTISTMPQVYCDIIGVCHQLPQMHDLQSLANEIYDGTVTVATDGSVWSGDGLYLWIVDSPATLQSTN